MNREKANWEQMRGPEGGFMSFNVCRKHKTSVCVCVPVCCVCVQAGSLLVAVISLVIYGYVSKDALAGPSAGFQM